MFIIKEVKKLKNSNNKDTKDTIFYKNVVFNNSKLLKKYFLKLYYSFMLSILR